MDPSAKYFNGINDIYDMKQDQENKNAENEPAEAFKSKAITFVKEQMADEPGAVAWILYIIIIICIWFFVFIPLLLVVFVMFTELLNQLLSIVSMAFIFVKYLQLGDSPDYIPTQLLSQICWIFYSMPVVTFLISVAFDLTGFCFTIIRDQATDLEFHKDYISRIKRWIFMRHKKEQEIQDLLLNETRPQTLKTYETFYFILRYDNKEKRTQAIALGIFIAIVLCYVICVLLGFFNIVDLSIVLEIYTLIYLFFPCIGVIDCLFRSWRNIVAVIQYKMKNSEKLLEIRNIEIHMQKQKEQFEINNRLYKLGVGSNPDTFEYRQQQRDFQQTIDEKKKELDKVRCFDPCYYTTSLIRWLYKFHVFEMVYPKKMVGQDNFAKAIQENTPFIGNFPFLTFFALLIGMGTKIYLYVHDYGVVNANSYYPYSIIITIIYILAGPYTLILSHICGSYTIRQWSDKAKQEQERKVKLYQEYFEGIEFFPDGKNKSSSCCKCCKCWKCCKCCKCCRCCKKNNDKNDKKKIVEYEPLVSAWVLVQKENRLRFQEMGYTVSAETDQEDGEDNGDPEKASEQQNEEQNENQKTEENQEQALNERIIINPNIPNEDEFGNTPETKETKTAFSLDSILNQGSIKNSALLVQGIYCLLMVVIIICGIFLLFWQPPIERICHDKIYLPSLNQQGYFDPPPVNNAICTTTLNGLSITELAALPIIPYFANGEITYETRKHNIEVIIDLAFGRTRTRSTTFDMIELNCLNYDDCERQGLNDVASVLKVYQNGVLDYNILIPFGLRDKGDWIPVLEMFLQQVPDQLLGEIVPFYEFFMGFIGDLAFTLTSSLQKVCGVRSVTSKHALRILDLASTLEGSNNIAVGQTIGGYFAKYIGYMLRQNFSAIGFDSLSFLGNVLVGDYDGNEDDPMSIINVYAGSGLFESSEDIPFNYVHADFDFGWQSYFRPPNATDAFCHAVAECSTDQMHIDFCDRMLGHERFMSTMVDIFHREWHPIDEDSEQE